ncbi:AzlD domain-containing protein [Kitasatospora aburaviensis]
MPDTPYLLAAIGVSAAVTWGLRALPFAALAPLRSSAVLHFLSVRMPVGVMVILTVYSLRDLPSPARSGPRPPSSPWPPPSACTCGGATRC